MATSRERFSLALERLKPSDWEHFEVLASTFLASEFGTLRTMAAPGGDGGRDAVLFSPEGEPETAFQYSVTPQWANKIRATVKRLEQTAPQTRTLIYVTNQTIGARADSLRKELRKANISLDVRDASFFLERADEDIARSNAAAALAFRFVDPLLADAKVLSGHGVLNSKEANTALLYIEMQQQDDAAGKGLTRTCFEALTKAALRDTTPDARMPKSEVYKRVQASLPQHSPQTLQRFVDAALHRLKRKAISQRSGVTEDEFNINHLELERQKDAAARLLTMHNAFERDVTDIIGGASGANVTDMQLLMASVHKILQIYFLKRGEEFAATVALNADPPLHEDDLRKIVRDHFPARAVRGRDPQAFGLHVVSTLLATPSEGTRGYLRLLSDSYTLMSFLSATPDVEAATRKLFSNGTMWVDTGMILPILAETVNADEQPFTNLFRQARQCGIRVHVTWGVVEEIERHLNRCRAYSFSTRWEGEVPYVYARYIFSGGKQDFFRSWLEKFTGPVNPIQDLGEFLSDECGFLVGDDFDISGVPAEIREGLTEYWRGVHEGRRNIPGQEYNVHIDQLTRHDVENCLIVLSERRKDKKILSKLGNSSWWLTLDRAAGRMSNALPSKLSNEIGHPLVISLDFLMRYIAFGPIERSLRERNGAIPVSLLNLLWRWCHPIS
ncbi:hypothetical protein [Mesorhizobium sp. B2-3-15]|uniref:hypothetical protein n=1 Tax=Mesorhizobium sp. B2-3-15 TaxID=2589949 RepID=UPI0011299962|nr:hypothetical protein [Mesorhizobium sp. B2-3-15]TPL72291.1 hypothetical protein FJ954_16485 [Mesorhizobium sp. B2-3-15]